MRWIVSFSACLLLAGRGGKLNIRSDTPVPYHLSRCTQEYMKAQHAAKALPRWVAIDWNEVTDLNLTLEARRKLEDGHGTDYTTPPRAGPMRLARGSSSRPCLGSCELSPAAIGVNKHFKGYSPVIYSDVARYPTIGFGHLIKPGETRQEPLLGDAAERLLQWDIAKAAAVNARVSVPMFQGQFDAAMSWT